jgi:DNA-3-methyladenine glycosylase II
MNPHASEKGRDFNEMSAWRQQEYESKAKQGLSVYAENKKGATMYTLNWQPLMTGSGCLAFLARVR